MEEDSRNEERLREKSRQNITIILVLIVIFVLVCVGYFTFLQKNLSTSLRDTVIKEVSTQEIIGPTLSLTQEEGFRQVIVEGKEFSFSPSSLYVSKGERIRLTFKNVGNSLHDFVIDELGVSTKKISAGESTTIDFVADKEGIFKFYCSIGNHRSLGMEGQIDVK